MATYYVRVDGNDSNTGTGSGSGQAWQTISKALGATGIGSGDTLYIAPGSYRQASLVTIGGTYSVPTYIYGNPTASEFSGVTPGRVLITTRQVSDTGAAAGGNQILFSMTSKNYLNFENIVFELANSGQAFSMTNCIEIKWRKCLFMNNGVNFSVTSADNTTNGLTKNYLFQQCHFASMASGGIFFDSSLGKPSATQNFVYGFTVDRCVCTGNGSFNFSAGGATFGGTTFDFWNNTGVNIVFNAGAGRSLINVRNNISSPGGVIEISQTGTADRFVTNNVAAAYSLSGNVVNLNNSTASYLPYNTGIWRLWGMTQYDWFSADGLYTYAAGSSTGTPATDFYGDAWAGGTPNIGSYNNTTATIAGQYNPTERNASTITIAPGSTSQSIELYLGATGLTFATSGLAAYYVRNQSAPVAITLVTQTATGAWTSGGFAEIDSSLVPGVYRLDVPNAAFAAGASDVTIVVRGASGTNGAVLTVTLSSGGLTSAQTAAAVWDEARASHTTAGTFGQYVNAELVTPVTSAALVRMGPFEVRADGLGASDPLDIQTGAQHGIDIQCVDNNGAGIDITSATVTAKVYNSGATLVDTYSCTATYAADGRATFTIDTTVTDVPGTYTATITRTTGASDTQIFGPLRIYVRDI